MFAEFSIGLISDIHGNAYALRAVLDDIRQKRGAIPLLVLGDLVAMGAEPVEVLDILRAREDLTLVRGNTDRYVAFGDLPPGLACEDPETRLLVRDAYQWTTDKIADAAVLEWLGRLPTQVRIQVPGSASVEAVHASLGRDDGPGLLSTDSDRDMEGRLRDATSDILCAGHTHLPLDRSVMGLRVVNPGSVGNPVGRDVRAKYALIDFRPGGADITFSRVDYEHAAVLKAVRRSGHPAADKLMAFEHGERLRA